VEADGPSGPFGLNDLWVEMGIRNDFNVVNKVLSERPVTTSIFLAYDVGSLKRNFGGSNVKSLPLKADVARVMRLAEYDVSPFSDKSQADFAITWKAGP